MQDLLVAAYWEDVSILELASLLILQAIYIGSALSFYFAYDFCLFPKTTPIFMYFLRYIPFFITIALTLAVIAFRQVQCMPLLIDSEVWQYLVEL